MAAILVLVFTLGIGSVWAADPVEIASGTFDGKNGTYTTGWSTTGTGKGRNDCIIIGSGENITSPSVDLSQYESITISIKARRYGTLTNSKATIQASFAGVSLGTTEASGTSATTSLTAIEYDVVTATAKTGTFVFTCTNATSAGSTHGAGINSIVITGVKKAAAPKPGVSVDPAPVAFGDVKQHSKGALDTEFVFKNFTVTGENLTGNITVNAPEGSIFGLWNPETESVIGTSIDLTPDANKAVEKELAIMAATGWSGAQNGSFTITGGGLAENVTVNITMNVTPTFEVAVAVNDAEMGTATINDKTSVYTDGDDELTITATPKTGYEFVNWTVSDGDVLAVDDANSPTTTLTAIGAGTVTANFQLQSCTNLAAPALDDSENTWFSYDNGNLAWTAVANAETYLVNVREHDGDAHITNLRTSNTSTNILNLKANTQYDYTVMAEGDGETYCDENNAVLAGSFTTKDYPAATLTLSENGVTRDLAGDHKLNDVVTLPTEVETGVVGKVLVGWSKVTVDETDTKPTENFYEAGAEYTIAATADKLYAVYATETPGASTTKTDELTLTTTGVSGTSYTDWSNKTVTSGAVYAGNSAGGNSSIQLRAKDNSGIITTATGTGKVSKVTLTWNSNTASGRSVKVFGKNTAYTASSDLYGDGAGTELGSIADNATTLNITGDYDYIGLLAVGGALYLDKVAIDWTVAGAPTYSAYATSGPKLLANPTFSVAEGTYNAAQNVALSAAEGTIYYTLDGTEPTNASTEYTGAIALSTYGEHTIKAIAIDGDNKSEVVSATYTLKLPFASLEALVACEAAAEDSVTVSFENVLVTGYYYSKSAKKYYGVYLDVKGANGDDIEIYKNDFEVPEPWVKNGKLSGTLRAKWTHYVNNSTDVWELVPGDGFAWTDLTYEKPFAPISWKKADAEVDAATVTFGANDNVFPAVATTDDDLTTFAYSSSVPEVATINAETGAITLVKAGTTVITAVYAADDYYKETTITYTLTVNKGAAGLAWSEATATAYNVGKENTLPNLTNEKALDVTYTSSAEAVATISDKGVVALTGAGETVIKAAFAGNDQYTAQEVTYTLTVYAPASVAITGKADKTAYEARRSLLVRRLGCQGPLYR
jgi:hypothetical protein